MEQKTIWIILGKYFGTSGDDMKQTPKLRSMFNGRSWPMRLNKGRSASKLMIMREMRVTIS